MDANLPTLSRELLLATFRAMPGSVALLDAPGRVVAVNDRWRRFAEANEGDDDGYLGWSYLDVCRNARADGAHALARSLAGLLAGKRTDVDYEYPCHAPGRKRWFVMHATGIEVVAGRFAVVSHVDITDRRLAEMDAARRADRDDLTGLLNRGAFRQRLTEALARTKQRGVRVAVLFVDLDGFKQINDRFGHRVGDVLLEEVGGRLGRSFRVEDAVARFGGDEFVLFVQEGGPDGTFGRVAERLHECLAKPIAVGDETFGIEASIGVSLCPDHGNDVDALVFAADEAMYQAKRHGPGGTAFAGDPDA